MMHQPVRDITNKGLRKIIAMYPSIKVGRMVRCESGLELDLVYLLEISRKVKQYCEQPIELNIKIDGKWRKYTPDFLIDRIRNPRLLLVEVKPEVKIQKDIDKFRAAKKAAAQKGYEFKIVSDVFIRAQPRLFNVRRLTRYARGEIRQEALNTAVKYFNKKKASKTLYEAQTHLFNNGVTKNELFTMMYRGIIHIDVERHIEPNSRVTLNLDN